MEGKQELLGSHTSWSQDNGLKAKCDYEISQVKVLLSPTWEM
jgi:hypothetical protein